MTVMELAQEYKAYASNIRRTIHKNPEASMKEYETQKTIIKALEAMGIDSKKVAGTGVVGIIEGKKKGKTLALRADIDAIEVQEENELSYKSKNAGLMHACGHDGHTAGLLTAAKILKNMQDQLEGKVKLVFQPGEETAMGAKAIIEAGVLKDVDAILGLHLWNELEVGKISAEAGPRMASAGIFNINIQGKGGHGSMPNQGVDAALVGAATLMNLQSIVSREINPLDPAVLSVGIFKAGTRFNVIADEAYLEGTTRCFNLEVNDKFEEQINRVVEYTAKAYNATAVLDYTQLVLPTINNKELSTIAHTSIKKILGEEGDTDFEKTTGGEDFSYYGKYVKTLFAFVGCRNEKKIEYHPHHHSQFNIDEEALVNSAAFYAQFAIDFLKEAGND